MYEIYYYYYYIKKLTNTYYYQRMASINNENAPICCYITMLMNEGRFVDKDEKRDHGLSTLRYIRTIVKKKCIVSMSRKQYNHIKDVISRLDVINICIYEHEMRDCPFKKDVENDRQIELEREIQTWAETKETTYTIIKIELLDHYKI